MYCHGGHPGGFKSHEHCCQIQQNGGVLDEASIASSIELASQGYDSLLVNLAMLGLLLCWLVSVVHAYVTGRALDRAARTPTDSPE